MPARRFDSTSDFLDTGLTASKGAGDNFSFLAWVKLNPSPAGSTQLALVGHENGGSGNGFEVYIIADPDVGTGTDSYVIRFRPGNGHGDSNSSAINVDITTVPQCIAIVNDKSGTNEIRFYAGNSVNTLALVSTDTGRTLNSTPGANQYIGARKNSGGSVAESLTGTVGKIALFYDQVLTLTELKEAAPPTGTDHADIATYYYPMSGLSPEPDESLNNLDASVTGTTIVSGFGGEGSSRIFNGAETNYLGTTNHVDVGTNANCAWVTVDALGVRGTIFGNRYDAGYAFEINEDDELQISYQSSGVIYYMSVPLTIAGGASKDYLEVGVPLFVGCNITSIGPPAAADFYAGQNAADVEFIGSDTAAAVMAPNGVQGIFIGANNYGVAENALSGALSRVRRWGGSTNLTLEEFQQAAQCEGATPQDAECQMFFPMTGAEPEPNSGTGVDADVIGFVPTGGDLCLDGVPFVGVQVDKVVQVIESITNGIAIDKVVQIIEYYGANVHIVEELELTDDPDGDGRAFQFLPIKHILEVLHLSDSWKPMTFFKIKLLEILNLEDTVEGENVGSIQILTQVFTKPIKFTMELVRSLFFGGR